jgi:hypothetical protein
LNGKIRSAPFDSILCDYSVAFETQFIYSSHPVVDKFNYISEGCSISDFCSRVSFNNCISSLTSCESAYSFWLLVSSHLVSSHLISFSSSSKVQFFELFHSKYQHLLNSNPSIRAQIHKTRFLAMRQTKSHKILVHNFASGSNCRLSYSAENLPDSQAIGF